MRGNSRVRRIQYQRLLTGAAWIVLLWVAFYQQHGAPMFDFIPTYAAARVIGDATRQAGLYELDTSHLEAAPAGPIAQTADEIDFPFTPPPFLYPPFWAWLWKPLSACSYPQAKAVLLAVSGASLVLGVWVLGRIVAVGWRAVWPWASLAVLGVLFTPLSYGVWLGQVTTLVLGLTCVSLWLAVRGRDLVSGALLGFVLAVKIFPLGVLVMLIAAQRVRSVIAAVVTWASLLAVGATLSGGGSLLPEYLDVVRRIGASRSIATWNNQSITGFLLRFSTDLNGLFRWSHQPSIAWISAVEKAVVLGFLGWSVLTLYRYAKSVEGGAVGERRQLADWPFLGLVYAQGILLSLILSPVVWTHYHLLVLVPVCWIGERLYDQRRGVRQWTWLVPLAIALGLLGTSPLGLARIWFTGAAADARVGAASIALSAPLFGTLSLFVLLNLSARPRPSAAPHLD